MRPCLSFLCVNQCLLTKKPLSPTTSTCISSRPGPSPALGKKLKKENQWFLYLSTGRADSSIWLTDHKRWLTYWNIDQKRKFYKTLQHHERCVGVGNEWEARINLCLRCQLYSHICLFPFLNHSSMSRFSYLRQMEVTRVPPLSPELQLFVFVYQLLQATQSLCHWSAY